MDRLEAMGVFVAVADLRGFAPAARRLGLSPSAVTRFVAALEERLGARLLQRTSRSVTLTDAGSQYLERARRILADVAEAEDTALAERSVPSGRFALTAHIVFGRIHVAPAMSSFLGRHPAVVGELTLADRLSNLVEEGIDAAVRIGVLEDSSQVAVRVGATRRVVVASPKYLARHRKPRTPDDVAGHDIVQCTAINPAREWRFTRDSNASRAAFVPRYVTNSVDAAIGHAERGFGLTMVLAYQVVEAVRAGRLHVLLADFEPPPVPIQLVYPSTRLLSAKVRAFLDHIKSTCDWQFIDLSCSS
jgi:DNA-binding transcriptional LysR family regulator